MAVPENVSVPIPREAGGLVDVAVPEKLSVPRAAHADVLLDAAEPTKSARKPTAPMAHELEQDAVPENVCVPVAEQEG